jgi:hypothetical protein
MSGLSYAPGKPGFGSRGDDGSMGLPGLSIYFTDYNTTTEAATIRAAITNNNILWKGLSSTPLPSNRVYATGDLFVDTEGKVYEIDAENDTFTYKFANLNAAGYFTSAEVASDTFGYNRYLNNNTKPKYLIDSVYSQGEVNYYDVPSTIYGIAPKNYARIEFSNIGFNNYNPFTLFSSAISDDAHALAIVRDISNNMFRLGNLDNNGLVRNVNLTFDVASLRVNRNNPQSYLTTSAPEGTIISNFEINANPLFNGLFITNPSTFRAVSSQSSVTVSWIKEDFTEDTDVIANLIFYRDISTLAGQTITMSADSSTYRPLVVHNCNQSGSVIFSNLPELTAYKYYMEFLKNGWIRQSEVKSIRTIPIPNITIIPTGYTWPLEASTSHYVGFCVSSNVEWLAGPYVNPDNFLTDISVMGTIGGDSSLYVRLTDNTGDNPRTGSIRVLPKDAYGVVKYASISQRGAAEPISIDMSIGTQTSNTGDWSIYASNIAQIFIEGLPEGTSIDVSIYCESTIINYNSYGGYISYDNSINVSAPGKSSGVYTHAGTLSNAYPYNGFPTTTTHSSVISLVDVSTSNIPITINLGATATTDTGGTYMQYSTNLYVTNVLVRHRSGTRVIASYVPPISAAASATYYYSSGGDTGGGTTGGDITDGGSTVYGPDGPIMPEQST